MSYKDAILSKTEFMSPVSQSHNFVTISILIISQEVFERKKIKIGLKRFDNYVMVLEGKKMMWKKKAKVRTMGNNTRSFP